jgi:hypothetical protein
MPRGLLILTLVAVGIPAVAFLGYAVHCTLNRVCISHARKFCRQQGLAVTGARCQPAFSSSGVKTEYSLVQTDCIDAGGERRRVLLLVGPFGVRKLVSNEANPES